MEAALWQCFELWAAAVDQAGEELRSSAMRERRMSMALNV
jgi:hypothetical protein